MLLKLNRHYLYKYNILEETYLRIMLCNLETKSYFLQQLVGYKNYLFAILKGSQ